MVAIESAIDISNHIIAKTFARSPEDYADAFRILAENEILKSEFADELIKMVKFRNLIIHLYRKVDDNKVHEILQTRLNDFENFLKAIGTFLKQKLI